MAENSNISWTDHTFNPWIGCTKISPGCAHCYAAEQNKLRKWTADGEWGKERRRTSESNWRQPVKWNKAAASANSGLEDHAPFGQTRPRVFCASLADWLDDEVPVEWLADLLVLIETTPHLDWLLLTKRPENFAARMAAAGSALRQAGYGRADAWLTVWTGNMPPQNVWIGTTVENQDYAERRIPHLLSIPARVRFLSAEPMLGPVTLPPSLIECGAPLWVICGGESGPHRREFSTQWARELADQCLVAGVPFFMKQDAALRSGQQGNLSEELWSLKQFPEGGQP